MLTEVVRGTKQNEVIDFVLEECCNCSVPFLMPSSLQKRLRSNPGELFYCPNGHSQYYTGKTEAQKLKEQLDETKKKAEQQRQDMENRYLDTLSRKIKLEKELKRVHKGVCPCCNRSFTNLHRHMKTKHPELDKKP